MSNRGLENIQHLPKIFLSSMISEGDLVLDCTAGLGRDTLFLARLVGPRGKVYAFDIQDKAVEATKKLLQDEGLLKRVEVLQADHADLREWIKTEIKAAVFNLGFLPGSDHQTVTNAESTIEAIKGCLELLAVKGAVSITVYRGHRGGEEEAAALNVFTASLPGKVYSVLQGTHTNQKADSPYWIMIQKNRRIRDENQTAG
ncbi:rRNA methylase [Syntrophobotulus glycolicus DSM 8271]|uniref:rRNA methylase n=1 Tax=Syntrophobotulus glycolicus (strain DSM 8271 / FlGlyR) TaxID=645991 RepID=F0T093_SYNGF|nr:class I SAM-dependent methyltransferase [Syntrophobotulus glycolicus]ADY56180.1 rRNA methylase [Syntrophobotulus glycolicus DSM 8271]